jgi:hypothetical protein
MIRLRDSPKDFQASVHFYGLSDKIIKKNNNHYNIFYNQFIEDTKI